MIIPVLSQSAPGQEIWITTYSTHSNDYKLVFWTRDLKLLGIDLILLLDLQFANIKLPVTVP